MKIAIAGSVLVDRINEIAAYPHEGELTQIRRVSRAVGGCVPNVAIDIKRVDPSLDVLAVGCVVSFLVSMLVIKGLMEYVRKHSFSVFGVYRIVLGIVVLAYFAIFA